MVSKSASTTAENDSRHHSAEVICIDDDPPVIDLAGGAQDESSSKITLKEIECLTRAWVQNLVAQDLIPSPSAIANFINFGCSLISDGRVDEVNAISDCL